MTAAERGEDWKNDREVKRGKKCFQDMRRRKKEVKQNQSEMKGRESEKLRK